MSVAKEHVREYWEAEPCGTRGIELEEGTIPFFAQLDQDRLRTHPFLDRFAHFEAWHGQRVLEVGVGPGTDFIRFVRGGAIATGVDLTQRAVDLVHARLANEGLAADVLRADAEALPFPNDSFDFVYSWGVIHHTPDPRRAAEELVRVACPGGHVCAMVYNRRSLVAAQSWILNGLLRGRPFGPVQDLIAENQESPGTQSYSRKEARALFEQLRTPTVRSVVTSYDLRFTRVRHAPLPLRRVVPATLGWFLVVEGVKA